MRQAFALAEKSRSNSTTCNIVVALRRKKRMYCSSCGVIVAQGLSYCNYCGATLGGAKSDSVIKSSEVKPEFLVAVMVCLFIFGLLAIAVLLGVMKRVAGFDPPILLAFTMFSFTLMLVVEGLIIRLLLKGGKRVKATGDTHRLKEQTTKRLREEQSQVLPEFVPSVTEHTTRAFEPAYRERESK
jgi:hypothetical protein